MYGLGEGAKEDLVQGLKWIILADKAGNKHAVEALELFRKKMSPNEIRQAEELAAQRKRKGRF